MSGTARAGLAASLLVLGLLGAAALIQGCGASAQQLPEQLPEERNLGALLERVDAALAKIRAHRLHSERDSPSALLHGIVAFGRELQIHDAAARRPVAGVDYLFARSSYWELPILRDQEGRARVTEGFQAHEDQLLMAMARAGVAAERRLTADSGRSFSVAELLRHSRARVVEAQELGWTLVALSTYTSFDDRWTTDGGASYRLEDLVELAVYRDPRMEACGGTHHLFGVGFALRRYREEGGELVGVWARARDYLDNFIAQARDFQQPSGELSAAGFRGPAAATSRPQRVFMTGHGLEWLTTALADEELAAPWVFDAAWRLADDLLAAPADSFDDPGRYHAAHALDRYARALRRRPAAQRHPPVPPVAGQEAD